MTVRLTCVITGLGRGGAETALVRLLGTLDRARFAPDVVSLTDEGCFGDALRALDVPVTALGMRPSRPSPLACARLASHLRRGRPHVVHTWMYHANLLGGLAARAAGAPVVWGLRVANVPVLRRATRAVVRLGAALSRRVPRRIVACGAAVAAEHARLGYAEARLRVIPNGFDAARFRPDPAARARLGVPADAFVVGHLARFHPDKDHANLIAAAARARAAVPGLRLVLGGTGVTEDNADLGALLDRAGVRDIATLLGPRDDVAALLPAFDVSTCASRAEGLPNSVGEAMACGTPVVATDVGDVRWLVGDAGLVVPPGDPGAIAEAWRTLAAAGPDGRRRLGARGRARVVARFSQEATTRAYETLYAEVAR